MQVQPFLELLLGCNYERTVLDHAHGSVFLYRVLFTFSNNSIIKIDHRYATVGYLIKNGRITCFRQMFNILPKSVMAADLHMNNLRFGKLMHKVSLFRVKDLFRIAQLLDIHELEILNLIYQQYKEDKINKPIWQTPKKSIKS